ncbi:MAG: type II toxin-antitoxin system VapC family toxin [Gallionellaceae bacterium]|nr:MAG: type II toxin-antitoxin system VapC family toxin [Gallionellaceae bacterium]
MKLLLDTHILLWYLEGHPNLPETQRQQIEDRRNQVAVSAVSLWEMTIKIAIGKLDLMDDLATVENTLLQQGIRILPIQTAHLQRLLELPFHHRDPFDRLIIAQALAEEMTLVSDDAAFTAYPASLLTAASSR